MTTPARRKKRRGPGRPTKKKEKAQETDLRAQLVTAARALFAEKGFEKTSTREIASAVGANIGLISYYFGGKEELYLAVLQESAQQLQAGPVFTLSLEGMDRAGFRALMRGVIALHIGGLLADPELMLIVQRELLDGAPRCLPIINGPMQQMLDQLVLVLKEGKRLGFVRPELHEVTFLMLLSRAISGYFYLHRQLKGRADVVEQLPAPESEAALDQIFSIFCDGALS
jgi:TetR/AcrR family transcriptional regulator